MWDYLWEIVDIENAIVLVSRIISFSLVSKKRIPIPVIGIEKAGNVNTFNICLLHFCRIMDLVAFRRYKLG